MIRLLINVLILMVARPLRSGLVAVCLPEKGPTEEGATEKRPMEKGTTEEGTTEEGTTEEGPTEEGAAKKGPALAPVVQDQDVTPVIIEPFNQCMSDLGRPDLQTASFEEDILEIVPQLQVPAGRLEPGSQKHAYGTLVALLRLSSSRWRSRHRNLPPDEDPYYALVLQIRHVISSVDSGACVLAIVPCIFYDLSFVDHCKSAAVSAIPVIPGSTTTSPTLIQIFEIPQVTTASHWHASECGTTIALFHDGYFQEMILIYYSCVTGFVGAEIVMLSLSVGVVHARRRESDTVAVQRASSWNMRRRSVVRGKLSSGSAEDPLRLTPAGKLIPEVVTRTRNLSLLGLAAPKVNRRLLSLASYLYQGPPMLSNIIQNYPILDTPFYDGTYPCVEKTHSRVSTRRSTIRDDPLNDFFEPKISTPIVSFGDGLIEDTNFSDARSTCGRKAKNQPTELSKDHHQQSLAGPGCLHAYDSRVRRASRLSMSLQLSMIKKKKTLSAHIFEAIQQYSARAANRPED
ncbi:hypothetical protein EV360DRAFT_73807 [Lentinula raphanica]|nr:hypothetical protein EV360DRAFT_73807 [Lentinula raphanica]